MRNKSVVTEAKQINRAIELVNLGANSLVIQLQRLNLGLGVEKALPLITLRKLVGGRFVQCLVRQSLEIFVLRIHGSPSFL